MTREEKNPMRTVRSTAFLLVVGAVLAVTQASAQEPPARRPGGIRQQGAAQEGITFNFQNLDLASVVTAMGQAAGINVLSTNMPEVLVNYRNPQPMTSEQVGAVIRELALRNGVAVTELPGVLLLEGPLVQEGEVLEPRFLYIHRLQHANALVLASTLQALFGGALPTGTSARQAPQTLSQQLQAMEHAVGSVRPGSPDRRAGTDHLRHGAR